MNKLIVLFCSILFSSYSFAHKECDEKIKSIYVGDGGYVWIGFEDGGMANMNDGHADFNNILTVVLAAKMSGQDVTMRYASDSATCGEVRSDIKGVWVK